MKIVYIALGSNLQEPCKQLKTALISLSKLPKTCLGGVSSFYQSRPLGPQDQPDYVNAVAYLYTELTPIELLDQLQNIEQQQGRVRLRHWGERTLDLDILLYGDQCIRTERLTIPHYDMTNREFVMVPLYEISPSLKLPTGEAISNLMAKFSSHQMQRIEC